MYVLLAACRDVTVDNR